MRWTKWSRYRRAGAILPCGHRLVAMRRAIPQTCRRLNSRWFARRAYARAVRVRSARFSPLRRSSDFLSAWIATDWSRRIYVRGANTYGIVPRFFVNNGFMAKEFARMGYGVALVMRMSVETELRAGTLVEVAWSKLFGHALLSLHFRDHLPSAAARALAEALRQSVT